MPGSTSRKRITTRYAALFANEAATQRESQEATRTYQTSLRLT